MHVKSTVNSEIKQKIAVEAAKLIRANDSVFIASGSTVYAFAERIRPVEHLNVVTPSLRVAMLMNELEDTTVTVLGGVLYKKSLSVRGEYAALGFENVICSKLFFGTDGIDSNFGITCATAEEATLTQKMMRASAKNIVLADSSKFGRRGFGRICSLDQVDCIVTDDGISELYRKLIEEAGVDLIVVKR